MLTTISSVMLLKDRKTLEKTMENKPNRMSVWVCEVREWVNANAREGADSKKEKTETLIPLIQFRNL